MTQALGGKQGWKCRGTKEPIQCRKGSSGEGGVDAKGHSGHMGTSAARGIQRTALS